MFDLKSQIVSPIVALKRNGGICAVDPLAWLPKFPNLREGHTGYTIADEYYGDGRRSQTR